MIIQLRLNFQIEMVKNQIRLLEDVIKTLLILKTPLSNFLLKTDGSPIDIKTKSKYIMKRQ